MLSGHHFYHHSCKSRQNPDYSMLIPIIICTMTGTLFREQSKGQSQATESTTKATDVEKGLVDNNNLEELEQFVEGGELTDTNICDPAVLNSDSNVIVENDAQQ